MKNPVCGRSAAALAILLALLGALLAWGAQQALSVFINGKAAGVPPVVKDGEIYIPVSALRAAGAQVTKTDKELRIRFEPAQGGAYQAEAVEGRLNEWLFNGLWRVQVSQIEPITDPFNSARPGWAVTLEFANGSRKSTSQFVTGVTYPELYDEKDRKLTIDENDWQTGSWFKELPPGGKVKHSAKFYYPSGTPAASTDRPKKLLILVDVNNGNFKSTGLKYSVKNPSFRISLEKE